MQNKYVKITLEQQEDKVYNIIYNETIVGTLRLSDKAELYFEVKPAFQGKHIAASAIYDFTILAHQTLHEPLIHAAVDTSNEMARHVLEHNGYSILTRTDNKIYYEHRILETRADDNYIVPTGQKVLYVAGGCFWGTERVFKMLTGVTATATGYANGHTQNPTYEQICRMETGFKETVRVTYDPLITPTEKVLKAYFLCIDPEQADGQKEDIGSQYQTGIYYKDPTMFAELAAAVDEEKKKHNVFYTELKPLECFYEAEEYHQDYLLKNPSGYCHITKADLQAVAALN
ncbi:MAG: peptide-methionine (S)-S-oxide reductase MsrA [Treponema sp.]|nr:peptide-methionine (S)-S-oxide reductase MsrA [Treponema sp.]